MTIERNLPRETFSLSNLSPFIQEPGLLRQGKKILNMHTEIASQGVLNPYFKFTGKGEKLFSINHRNGLIVTAGRIGAFSQEEMAVFVQAVTQTYVSEGTMGSFPTKDPNSQQALLAIFMGNFSESHTPIIISKFLPSGERVLVGGCVVSVGNTDESISNLIGNPNATLPTLSALSFSIPDSHMNLASTPENQVFGVNKLFRLTNDLCERYGISAAEKRYAVEETLAGISIARRNLEQILQKPLLHGLADLSDQRVLRLVNSFGWEAVAVGAQPTSSILNTVLAHHYGYSNQGRKNLFIISAQAQELDRIADGKINTLETVAENTPHWILEEQRRKDEHHSYIEKLNSNIYEPHRFEIQSGEGLKDYKEFLRNNLCEFVDSRVEDLTALYRRFHPFDQKFDSRRPGSSANFTNWLSKNGVTDLEKQGMRLALPQGYVDNKLIWRVIAVLPENLQRQIQEASAWKMMDSLDGKVDTRKLLHDDVDLIVVGASVGSVIASALVTALGVNHLTIVDSDTQDGIGTARVDDPKLSHHGKLKVVKVLQSLLEITPYLRYKIVPEKISVGNIDDILAGIMPQNPNRRLVVIEEVDDLTAKDLIRKKIRENHRAGDKTLLISVADIGRASIKAIIEEPQDLPYGGVALRYTNDPYGSGVSRFEGSTNQLEIAKATLSKILATYGLIMTSENDRATAQQQIPQELINALKHLLGGEIGSFEQSGLSTRLAGIVAGKALLVWLEGQLATKEIKLNLADLFDKRVQDPNFIKKVLENTKSLQIELGLDETL